MSGDAYRRLLDAPPDLPVVAGLADLLAAVRSGGAAVLPQVVERRQLPGTGGAQRDPATAGAPQLAAHHEQP